MWSKVLWRVRPGCGGGGGGVQYAETVESSLFRGHSLSM